MKITSLDVLEKAALPSAHARAILRAMELEWEAQQQTLATKADLENLRLATKADLENLRLAMKADLEKVRGDVVRWVFTCILGQSALLMGAVYFVLTHLGR